MSEFLHPSQLEAIEKLKQLRVGALYISRQNGKLRTVLSLVRFRLRTQRIHGVIWLCTGRKKDLIQEGVLLHAPGEARQIHIYGTESLSHNLSLFLELMRLSASARMMLVIDNGLLIKNANALRTQRVIALSQQCPYRLLISDVPFSRHMADMFPQWYALDWRILGYRTYWGFSLNHLSGPNGIRNADYLARAIEPYCVQISREDVQPRAGRKEYVWKFPLPPEGMAEYQAVMQRFLHNALYSSSGVYRLLQACHHVACGQRIVQDFPLTTTPLYPDAANDPRMNALLEVIENFPNQHILILCRHGYEFDRVCETLMRKYGPYSVWKYPEQNGMQYRSARFCVMNVFTEERENARLQADVMIYYSNDWNWQKRAEKEAQCQNALGDGTLTVVSLVAAGTLDIQILRSLWKKERLVSVLRSELWRQNGMPPAEQ